MGARRKLLLGIGGLAAIALFASPWIAWRAQRPRTMDVVIVDKTVPFESYREHAGIPWILHAMKIQQPGGRFLEPARDYVGFDPKTKTGHDLTDAHLAHADVLVIADTYGVYRGDYERPGDQAALERSPKIYGGLSNDEARAVASFWERGGLVLAEFNTFASPTPPPAREMLERVFGVRWTKWVARYWPNLQDPNEVPRWLARTWERVTHTPFDMRGGGLVFVREDEDIVVLLDGEDLDADVVRQVRTPRGASFDLPPSGGFWLWMDVVEATDGEVLYEHVVATTAAGQHKLARHGLPVRFPALTKHRDAWYFAGDFVDTAMDLGSPERYGLIPWRARTTGCGGGSTADDGSFWGFYAPIVERLFSSRAR